ncbi:MAG: hypothetical protein M0P69_04540 [Bacteroidales bacterium]|jgi:hypothetical protein|nr:hypothetical protein [Bacteroidales bacterium]MDD2570036.1 hypothetical protein [Bacteroidales bacterium]MDD2812242.1 hypothetical protein [Bacteroidales bacterium]MDD3385272.1 hypothetical protein [Bacteroidales bacterium]MDD3871857.1 hypothetical protein [Bacteroidales bacterium]
MNTEQNPSEPCKKGRSNTNPGASGAVYGLGFIGAAIFFIGQATTFWAGVLGFLKAIIWPVFLILKALQALYS